jgi:hypothetical protein
MSNEIIDIVEEASESNEFEVVKAERGPTQKQLKKIERDYSELFKEEKDEFDDTSVTLTKADLAGVKRIAKYIENVRLANKMTDGEYVQVKKRRDDDDVRELDCNFERDMGESLSRGRRMFED